MLFKNNVHCKRSIFFSHYSLSLSLSFFFFFLVPFQAENKGENETDEGDKAQDGENEKNSEKEQDSEVSEDTKSGNLRKLFGLY